MIQQVDTFWLSKNPLLRAVRRTISIYPGLYIPLRKMRRSDTVVTSETDLLIEGFPRSGNTWTEALIREASGDGLSLAHHAHAAAHVKRAIQLGVPALILFRDPDDAVTSLLTLNENQLDARGAYLEYERFYKTVWALRGPQVRFYSFNDVTRRCASFAADVSASFGLDLTSDALDSEVGQSRIFARMDEKAERLRRRSTSYSKSRPDIEIDGKDARRARAMTSLRSAKANAARDKAYAIYGQLTSSLPPSEARDA